MIDALVFDLDDTLYRESDFVASGYRAVAHHIAICYGWPENQVFGEMMTTFEAQGREKVLAIAVERFLDSSVSVGELVAVYRAHTPTIQMPPGYEQLLKRLHQDFRLGIITDGLPEVQKRKVQALNLEEAMDQIVYTWEYGPELEKPHPFGFSLMLDSLGTDPSRALFVGDNPFKDCRGAHNVGMQFIQVLTGSGEKKRAIRGPEEKAEFVIENLHELPRILQRSR